METTRKFNSIAELMNYELHNPGVLLADPAANAAAKECLEAKLEHAEKMLARTRRSVPGSVVWCAGTEFENKIQIINKWFDRLNDGG